jgi:hypothetical protein
MPFPPQGIIEEAVSFVRSHCDSTIMILSAELTYIHGVDIVKVVNQQLTYDIHISLLKAFDTPCIVGDEVYYIYQLTCEKSNRQQAKNRVE